MTTRFNVHVTVNGQAYEREVEARTLLVDFIRHELGFTGTHVGCEHGVCGTCTVLFDGEPVRACLMFAPQADGHDIQTVEGLGSLEKLHPIQEAFMEAHGAQCGFCTPGMMMSVVPFLAENKNPSDAEIREVVAGNLCRCTGYQHIIDAVRLAARKMADTETAGAGR